MIVPTFDYMTPEFLNSQRFFEELKSKCPGKLQCFHPVGHRPSRINQLQGGSSVDSNPIWYHSQTGMVLKRTVCCNMGWRHLCSKYPHSISFYASRTAQGGGGSFRRGNLRKPTGCCDSPMAERIQRWLELCFLEWLQWLQWSPHTNAGCSVV